MAVSQRRLSESAVVLLEGACIGTALAALLTVRNLFDLLLDDRISGVSAPALHRFLATEYRVEVMRAALELLALSSLVGAVTGLVVAVVWLLRELIGGSFGRVGVRRGVRMSVGILGCFALVYAHDVATRPALHQATLFEQGGIRAWAQRGLADVLGGPGVGMLGLVALGLWLGMAWLRRVRFLVATWLQITVVSRRWLLLVSVAGALCSVWLVGASPGRTPARVTAAKPNVLLLAADSLRPDRLDAQRAPNLASLAVRATSFDRAYTPLARTFPAWVSISTGKYPHHHGIRNMFPRWETRARHFDTLAERFGQAGYRTAVVGDFAADIFRRISLGYQEVRTPTFTMRELVREHLLKNDPWLLAWIRGTFMRWLFPVVVEMHEATDPTAVTGEALDVIERSHGQPFFLTVFYSTPHFPYAAPGPHHRRFAVRGYDGPFRYAKADTLNATETLTTADIAQVRALYDGAVFATDEAIGKLFEALKQRGLVENTVIVVTADHGEQLYEYSRTQGHGDHLFGDEALRVPLLIATPGHSRGAHVVEPVSLVDLAPTLLELAQLPPIEGVDGRSLASAIAGQPLTPNPVYSETGLWFTELIAEVPLSQRIPYPDLTRITEVDRQHGDQVVIRPRWQAVTTAAKHRMLQLGDWRLIYKPSRWGPLFQLCDLARDAGCQRDASAEQPELLAVLKSRLWQVFADDPEVIRRGDVLLPLVTSDRPNAGAPP